MIVLFYCGINVCSGGFTSCSTSGGTASTIQREKIETNNAYINDCIIDELGWFDSVSKTSSRLKEFWKDTGVQPYIILKDYDPNVTTKSQKEEWTTNYYDENFDTENIFLYVYFAGQNVNDYDEAYECYALGQQTSSVMDSEAIEIFWGKIDKYWPTDLSTDDVYVKAFTDTGDTIMRVSTTGKDIVKWALVVVVVIVVCVTAINIIKKKHKRAKEEAEEDAKILNTPLDEINSSDDLTNKYL